MFFFNQTSIGVCRCFPPLKTIKTADPAMSFSCGDGERGWRESPLAAPGNTSGRSRRRSRTTGALRKGGDGRNLLFFGGGGLWG